MRGGFFPLTHFFDIHPEGKPLGRCINCSHEYHATETQPTTETISRSWKHEEIEVTLYEGEELCPRCGMPVNRAIKTP